MKQSDNDELLRLVRGLTDRIDHLEAEIKSLKVLTEAEIPEDVLVAIAAAVAAYLGFTARKRQAVFQRSTAWQAVTRRSQQHHAPLHLR